MARLSKNSLMYGVRGMLAGQVIFKERNGKPYVAVRPEANEKRVPGKEEQDNRDRFKQSNEYASRAIKDEAIKKMYSAVATNGQSAHNVAFSDAFHPPVITGVIANGYSGRQSDIITIQAKDNFKVASVRVAIYDENGSLIEAGIAVDNGDDLNWIYTITRGARGSKIIVRAYDLPSNETVKEMGV